MHTSRLNAKLRKKYTLTSRVEGGREVKTNKQFRFLFHGVD